MHLVPTEWVLLDIRVQAVDRGFGHGLVHMYAEDGTLLATASQTCMVRFWGGDPDDATSIASSSRS
jgi:acyl-CoA thioesterase